MVTDTIKKVANAILDAGEGCQSGLVYVDPVEAAKAAIAVLSTDAEPVAWQAQSADGVWRYVEMPRTAKSMGMPVRPDPNAAAPAPAVAVKPTPEALEKFTAYFVKNYPGPDTIIFDPKWHAPKLFRAAVAALSAQVQDVAVPDRWKLVPDDATDAMVEAAANVDWSNENEMATVHNVWHAMLAAAPAAKLEKKP